MKTMIVGVSGDQGSFSEQAAMHYAAQNNINPSLRYLIDMDTVLSALSTQQIQLGVIPIHNTIGGIVIQTIQAMGKYPFSLIESFSRDIEQCLLSRAEIDLDQVTQVISHPQGLKQCGLFLDQHLNNATRIEARDTALAARDLANGSYTNQTVVIAPAACADLFGLHLLKRGIQDITPNLTTFLVVQS